MALWDDDPEVAEALRTLDDLEAQEQAATLQLGRAIRRWQQTHHVCCGARSHALAHRADCPTYGPRED